MKITNYWTGDAVVEDCTIARRVIHSLFEVCGWAGECALATIYTR